MRDHYNIEKVWPQLVLFFEKEECIYTKNAGASWRLLPREYGVLGYNAWAAKGVWIRLFEFCIKDPSLEWISIDSTIVRAHACAAGYEREGNDKHALGRSKGGFTTKIHIAV